jgi:Rps23 Pro-64 3,4-dihydroxylase Tpa1-like proline 4-hydroxylase
MIISRHKNFVDADTLAQLQDELLSTTNWAFRKCIWRYYVMDDLKIYKESDSSTWYGNQPSAMKNLREPWKRVFEQVHALAGPSFKFMRYAINAQVQGQTQDLHVDASDALKGDFRTYLIYLNTEWDQSWGGATEFQINHKPVHYEYPEPGKLVEFNSQIWHLGHAPEKPNFLRLSVGLHGQL